MKRYDYKYIRTDLEKCDTFEMPPTAQEIKKCVFNVTFLPPVEVSMCCLPV